MLRSASGPRAMFSLYGAKSISGQSLRWLHGKRTRTGEHRSCDCLHHIIMWNMHSVSANVRMWHAYMSPKSCWWNARKVIWLSSLINAIINDCCHWSHLTLLSNEFLSLCIRAHRNVSINLKTMLEMHVIYNEYRWPMMTRHMNHLTVFVRYQPRQRPLSALIYVLCHRWNGASFHFPKGLVPLQHLTPLCRVL